MEISVFKMMLPLVTKKERKKISQCFRTRLNFVQLSRKRLSSLAQLATHLRARKQKQRSHAFRMRLNEPFHSKFHLHYPQFFIVITLLVTQLQAIYHRVFIFISRNVTVVISFLVFARSFRTSFALMDVGFRDTEPRRAIGIPNRNRGRLRSVPENRNTHTARWTMERLSLYPCLQLYTLNPPYKYHAPLDALGAGFRKIGSRYPSWESLTALRRYIKG